MRKQRAAIYARYSTDLQSERSIEDQLALCRREAKRRGLIVVGTYFDAAVSGASTINRHGWLKLMRDAEAKRFDVVLAEDVDRIARDEADYHAARKRLAFLDIEIWDTRSGKVTGIEGSVRVMMASHYIENLAHKTRRGLAGVLKSGRHPGGRAYGYRVVPGKPGELEIVPEQAEVVRRIFGEYRDGRTPREIAHALNADDIHAPRGKRWTASALNGNKARGHGILQNELYAGRLVWNRVRMVKDPDTGKRVSRPNPKSEWQTQDAPHLAIVSREVFDAAQARKAERSIGGGHNHRRPKRLLSGLLKCDACGSGMSVFGADKSGKVRLRCSAATESNSCPDPKTFYLAAVEAEVVSLLMRELRDPRAMQECAAGYIAERNRLAAAARSGRDTLKKKLAKAQAEHGRTLKAYQSGVLSEETAFKELPRLQAECDRLKGELAAEPVEENTVALHPQALTRYAELLAGLKHTLESGAAAGDLEARGAIRELVGAVTVRRDPTRKGGVLVTIDGRLAPVLGDGLFPDRLRSQSVGSLVAGEGLEPPTRGL
jgi:site-specific DNA recombinase